MPAALVLALTAAAAWGAADFAGGVAGRRASPVAVAFASQFIGLAALLGLAPFVGASVRPADVGWGIGAGIGAAAGVALLYRGLAVGLMSVVAPVTAVGAACIPVVFGLLTGDRPAPVALAGVALALCAVALLCVFPATGDGRAGTGDRAGGMRAGLLTGAGSGVGFGAYFVFLGHAGHAAGMWPLVGSRATSTLVLAGVLLLSHRSLVPAGAGPGVALVGLLDVVANVSYLLATRRGLLSIVALLTSLYPAVTVALARVVLGERLSRAQTLGLLGVGVAVLLIATA